MTINKDNDLSYNKKVYDYAIRLLSRQDYSIHKLKTKLKSRKLETDDDEIETVIKKLISLKYIKENEYARSRIKQFLIKGFSNETIQLKLQLEQLSSTDEDINIVRSEENIAHDDQIQKLIQKKLRGKVIPDDFESKMKLKNKILYFLATKGHSAYESESYLKEFDL